MADLTIQAQGDLLRKILTAEQHPGLPDVEPGLLCVGTVVALTEDEQTLVGLIRSGAHA